MLGGRRFRGAQRNKYLINSFDTMAQSFDTDYRIKRARIIAEEINKRINVSDKSNVLEFGCGTGLITTNLIENINNLALVDSSEGMLEQLKAKLSNISVNKQITVYNDLFSTDLALYTYDLIYSSMVLHHIKNIGLFAQRFSKLLCQNGTLCIIDLLPVDKDYHINEPDFEGYDGFEPKWLMNQLESNGFVQKQYNVIYTGTKEINGKVIEYSLFILIATKKQ